MICVDTNVVASYLNGHSKTLVARVEQAILASGLSLPSIVLFELSFGVAKSPKRLFSANRLNLFLRLAVTVLPFDVADAEEAGNIRATLERAGTPIGPYDILIAAQARRRRATLVTANTREFARVSGLRLEDWTLP